MWSCESLVPAPTQAFSYISVLSLEHRLWRKGTVGATVVTRRSRCKVAPLASRFGRFSEVLSIYADLGITGFALLPPLENMLEGNAMRDMIAKAIMEGAMTAHIPWDCLLGFSSFESCAGDLLGDAIAALGFPWQLQLVELLSSDKLFCEEPWKTDGFDKSPCAKEIGCQALAFRACRRMASCRCQQNSRRLPRPLHSLHSAPPPGLLLEIDSSSSTISALPSTMMTGSRSRTRTRFQGLDGRRAASLVQCRFPSPKCPECCLRV